MQAPEDIDCICIDKKDENYWNTLNRESTQRYKISHMSDSNNVSHILLQDLLQRHAEALNTGTIQQVLQKKCSNKVESWTSSLKKIDAVKLFNENQPSCHQCSGAAKEKAQQISIKSCSCNLGINTMVTNATSALSFNENHKYEEPRPLFKPKFSKPKSKFLPQSGCKPESNGNPEVFVEKDVEEENSTHKSNVAKITFKSAREQLLGSNPAARRTLGATRKAQNKFISPMIGAVERQESSETITIQDDRLKHVDPKMVELIESEIIDKGTPIGWDDIAGLQMAKSVIQEAVVWPLLRPDIFTGLRRPPKGILLFGPPGTGKTLIGKCVAAQCNATFFSISASSLTSKWIGDGEKMVRALFAVATCHQPAVIFIDEIDSLLTQRSDTEHEATRRIKTEFLVQFDGAATAEDDRLLIVGATNRPQELDEAARRRLVKRLYIPLPDIEARKQIIKNLLQLESNTLTEVEVDEIAQKTDGYSGADMKSLCSEAAMGPIRSVPLSQIVSIKRDKVRPVAAVDFLTALQRIKPSVSQEDLGQYVKWNNTYGQGF